MGRTVLVTGGAGYVGSHVVVELARAGHAPIVLDNFATSTEAVLLRLRRLTGAPVPLVTADVRDGAALARTFSTCAIDAVVHCAGLKAVGESEAQPLAYYDNNIGGAIALAQAMAAARVKTLIFSSSATVYGQPDDNPVAEGAPLKPVSVYGRTKRAVEMILEDVAAADASWRIGLLRYFNPAGADASAEIGEAPAAPANLFPILVEVAAGRRACIDVFGDDYPTPDGTGVRDYVHVTDLAQGHVASLAHLERLAGVTTLNLGVGRGYSVLEIIAAFERACGRALPRRIAARRPGDIAICYADPARANARLGWHARRDLDAICADAWRWHLAASGCAT
jgi:UDP-glucose 4-epimerase